MKKVKILSLIIAVLMLAFCFVACDGDEPADTTGPAADPDAGKIKVVVNAYVMYELDSELEEYVDAKSPILLSDDGGIALEPGCGVKDAIKALATKRGAEVVFTDSGMIDYIKNGGDEYKSGEKIKSERFSDDGTKQYYDLVVWRWYLNDVLVENSSSVALKNGDKLELRLEIDKATTRFFDTIETEE